MRSEIAERFEKLVDDAHGQIYYDPSDTPPRLVIVNDTFKGTKEIEARCAETQWNLTDRQIEEADWYAWENEVWWYALHLAAKQIVEAESNA